MSKKTYNPSTGKYDNINTRSTGDYNIAPVSFYEDRLDDVKKDINDIESFAQDTQNNELILKSGYNDVLGLTAYSYKHALETKNKYLSLLDKYKESDILEAKDFSKEQPWNIELQKPKLLENYSDEEIVSLGNNYLTKANDYYNNVTKPLLETAKEYQQKLLSDGTFKKGITHFKDLPTKEQDALKQKLSNKGIQYNNDEDYNNVHINRTFKSIFGEKTFKETPFKKRKEILQQVSINSLLQDKFKDDPLLLRIQNLDTQDKIDLYNNSLFLNYNEALKAEEKAEKKAVDTAIEKLSQASSYSEDSALATLAGHYFTKNSKKVAKNAETDNTAIERREVLLEEYERKSNDKKIASKEDVIEELTQSYKNSLNSGSGSAEQIEQEFDETFSEILPHYWVFKDDWELKNFTLQDKIDYLSTYKSLVQEDPLAATQVVNDMMKKYIDNEQGLGTHLLYGATNATIGTIAELANMFMGIYGLGTAVIGGADAYADFMNSKVVKYLNDVSNYNTLNWNKHDLYDQYGGVSSWKGIASPGEEYDIFNLRTLEEVLSMGKYVASIMAATASGAGIASFAGNKILGLTGKALNTFMNTSKVLTQGFAASGMAHSMAKGTFDETYQKLQQQVNDRINFDLNNLSKNPTVQAEVVNDWLNSDLVNEELNKTLKQAEQEWNKQNRIAREKGTHLQVDKEQYLNSIKNEFLNAAYQDATSNIDNLVKNKYSQEIKDNNSLYSEDEVLEASARAAMIQASMSWVKEFAAGFLWNKWMIHKNARLDIKPNPMEGLRATETGVEAVKKAMTKSDYLKAFITRPIKEFGDEWLDVHTEHYSQGFGLQNFNNITANMYDPYSYLESMNIPYNIWRPTTGFSAGVKSVADGFFDEAGIYEGLIGAVSGFGGINVNIANVLKRATAEGRESTKKELEGKNFLYRLNHYVSNGVISDIVEAQENIMQKEGLATAINETIKKNGHILQSVHELLAANAAEEKAYAEKDEEAIKNAGVRVAFQLAMTLRDETLGALPQIQQKVADLERFSKGEITEEDIKLHRKQLQNSTTDVISDEEVIADLKNNSKKLLDIIAKTNKSFDIINKSKYGKSLSQQTKTQLVFNRVYDSAIDDELNALESQIKGSDSKYSTQEAPIGVEFSSEEGLAEHKKVQQETINALENRKKTIEKRLAIEKKGRSKNRAKYIKALELDLESLKRALAIEKEAQKELEGYTITEGAILSEEEILSLNPEKRAQMLNPYFRERYNKEQQKIIDNLISRLRMENPEVLDAIQLAGQLYIDKRLNAKAYDRILENSDIYDGYVEYMQQSFNNRAAKAGLNIVKRRVKEDLDAVEDSNLMEHLMHKSYSSSLVRLYREENIEGGTERERILKEAEDIFKTIETIGVVLNSYEDQTLKNSLRGLFQLIIGKTPITTSKEFLDSLIKAFEGTQGDLAEKAREVLQKVAKLTNQISTTSEEKQVDREQRKQENAERVTEEQKQHDEAKTQQPETKPEVKPEVKETTPSNTESPTITEQAQQAGVPVNTTQKDVTEEGNSITTSNNYVSIYPRYNVKALNEDGTLIPQVGAEENDRMNVFYRFLENRGIKLQDIIDFELHKILQKNPNTKVYFAMHSTNDSNFNNYMFAVVEYNDDVRTIHDESRGGTFTTLDGKKYLIIGAVGTETSNEGKQAFIELQRRLIRQRNAYTSNHTENDYFWVSNDYTQVKDIQAGRRVRSTSESEVKMRSISELLYSEDGNFNEESNPLHLGDSMNKKRGYSSLSWAIQKGEEWVPINTGSKKVIDLSSPSDNNGAVFVLIETAAGSLLPVYINPSFYNEIKDGALKNKINSALTKLLSKNFETRKEGKDELKQFLVLSDDNTFTIGKDGFNSISIKRNGSVFKTFNIDNGVNISEFLDAVKQANFRINVTISTLQTPGLIAEYDEAGALTTDVSVLHTRNASFTMYRIDNEGKPIIDDAPSYQPTSKPKEERQIQYGNKRYREENGVFKDELDKIVEDKELIRKLKFAQQIEKMEPTLQERGFNYYVIDDNKDSPVVIRLGSSKDIVIANKNQALNVIERINEKLEKEAKAKAAKKAYEEALTQAEQVDLGDLGFEESNTLSQTQQSLNVEPIIPESITPLQQTSLGEKQKDVNKASNILLENFGDSNKILTFVDIYEDIEQSIQLEDVFAEKGWKFGTQQEVEELLKSKNIPIIGITSFESWLDIIKNCR